LSEFNTLLLQVTWTSLSSKVKILKIKQSSSVSFSIRYWKWVRVAVMRELWILERRRVSIVCR